MSRRKKVNSWNCVEPLTPQEQRVSDREEPPRARGSQKYKDKKNWCRGKIGGRRHTGVVELRRETASWVSPDWPRCFRSEWGSGRWHCEHQEICSNQQCRKILHWSLGKNCPDYREGVTFTREMMERARSKK